MDIQITLNNVDTSTAHDIIATLDTAMDAARQAARDEDSKSDYATTEAERLMHVARSDNHFRLSQALREAAMQTVEQVQA